MSRSSRKSRILLLLAGLGVSLVLALSWSLYFSPDAQKKRTAERAEAMFWQANHIATKDKGYTKKSVPLLREAAEKGNARAQAVLAFLYYKGESVEQDYKQATKWYRKAALQGYPAGQQGLGVLYQEGKGVKQNYQQAAEWYRRAALQGQVEALNYLALLYFKGQGVKKNYAASYGLFLVAAEAGDDFAKDSIGKFERGLDTSDIIQGRFFATDWKRLIRENSTEFTNVIGGEKTSFTLSFKKKKPKNCAGKFEMFRFFMNWFNPSPSMVFCFKDKKDRTIAVTVRKGKGHGVTINRDGSIQSGPVNPAKCAGPMKVLLYFVGFGKDKDLVFC